jgi:hypothetical protein
MKGYLGEFKVDIKDTPYKDYTSFDWVMYFIEKYGQTDGDHHKAWLLDQISRIFHGTTINIVKARWDNGYFEYRISTDDQTTKKYQEWVNKMTGGGDYDYEIGIAP